MQPVSWQGYVSYAPTVPGPTGRSMTPPAPVFWPAPSVVTAGRGGFTPATSQLEARLPCESTTGSCAEGPVRSRSAGPATLPRPRTLLKVEVLPAGKSRQRDLGEASCLVDLTNRPDFSSVPEPPKVMAPVSYVVGPRSIDATWSSTSTMLVAPQRPCEVSSPMAVNSWASDASTVAVPSVFPRPMAVSSGTQTDQGTESTEASPLPVKSPGWTQLVAEKARYLEERDRPPSEPSMEEDVKVAEMILRPVSESLQKLRCSIEASKPGYVVEALPRSPRDRVSFSPKAASRSSSPVPALLRSSDMASEELQMSGVQGTDLEGEPFSATLEVLTRLDSQLGNLESILRALEPKQRQTASPQPALCSS